MTETESKHKLRIEIIRTNTITRLVLLVVLIAVLMVAWFGPADHQILTNAISGAIGLVGTLAGMSWNSSNAIAEWGFKPDKSEME